MTNDPPMTKEGDAPGERRTGEPPLVIGGSLVGQSSYPGSPARVLFGAVAVVLARSRFLVLVAALLGLIAGWPFLQAYWGKLTRPAAAAGAVSGDTEYWCPMCPGVVSAHPDKCPVCFMGLVRRAKADMTPLPDGSLARVQLSPYRVQLAGLRTAPVEYRRLEYEAVVAGRLEADPKGSAAAPGLLLAGDVFDRDAALLSIGQAGAVACDSAPGEAFAGRVLEIMPTPTGSRVRVRVDDPRGDLRPGGYAAATFRTPAASLPAADRLDRDRWRDGLAAALAPDRAAGVLLDAAARRAAARAGLTLCVPEPAVIDTGPRRVVYVETMPGVFDATEVTLGRRCGDFYPVRSGVEAGQRVATAGAVLLDAETRLNPALAATYFGAGARSTPPPPAAPAAASGDDAALAARQKVCPVTKEPLDSMGGPVKLVVDGRVVFICCKGCEKALRAKPAEYLRGLPQ